jgi:Flp pilus assembly pilin Flp
MKIRTFLKRFAQSDDGGPATEAALLLALVAAIAGFGMVILGDSLASFYESAGESFDPGAEFPSQDDSGFLGGGTGTGTGTGS